jgi:hypothetical protein
MTRAGKFYPTGVGHWVKTIAVASQEDVAAFCLQDEGRRMNYESSICAHEKSYSAEGSSKKQESGECVSRWRVCFWAGED